MPQAITRNLLFLPASRSFFLRMEPFRSLAVALGFYCKRETPSMKLTRLVPVAALICAMFVASCANTIRGVGRDTANAVDATQSAGQNVANAAE
jgi:entericidin B